MTRWATPKLASYAVLSVLGLLTALVIGRPELVALTAPFLVALAAGLALATPPRLGVELALDETRVLEGGGLTASLLLEAQSPVDRLDLHLKLPHGVELVEGRNPVALRLVAGERRELELTLRAAHWGGHVIGPVYVRAFDPIGLLAWESAADTRQDLRVYPREEALRRVLSPRETQLSSGDEVARRKGEGIEFADIRRWTVGDPMRRINWRASARRGDLWVNENHPERNTDVILFVDAFAEARRDGESTLDLAARATVALADAYARRRDRVGLISFGGILRWLAPGLGTTQLYRVVEALLDTQIVLSYYWKEIDVIPRRTLPPNALVIALSPLLDPRSVGALLDLRARGHDLAVVDISPLPYTERPGSGLDAIAYDIWAMRRGVVRHALERSGVAIAEWRTDLPLQSVLGEVSAFRRSARHVHA
ncbi:MAG TPA: DUF58 domain-containing protein [Gaiellaceae bacterium]